MDFLENVPDYENWQLLMDQGLTYRPIVQEMMELETQYYNLQEDLEN